jgi:hypothetical protein
MAQGLMDIGDLGIRSETVLHKLGEVVGLKLRVVVASRSPDFLEAAEFVFEPRLAASPERADIECAKQHNLIQFTGSLY